MSSITGNCRVFKFVTLSTQPLRCTLPPRNPVVQYRNEIRTGTLLRCGREGRFQEGDKRGADALPKLVEEQVAALLKKEENWVLLDGLEKASERVDMARRQLGDVQRQELEAKKLKEYVNSLEVRASEIAESQRQISEARSMIENAERSLYSSLEEPGNALNSERLESAKAVLVSAIAGAFAGLPIYATQVTSVFQLLLPGAIAFISCALFGVTYRYAVRRDMDNVHLKTGTVAAFTLVKGLGMLAGGPPLEPNAGSISSHLLDGAVYVAENMLIFASAAVSVDFCFKMGIVSPFPMFKSLSKERLD